MRNPLDDLHAIAEVDYIREITQQLIRECLDQGDDAPLGDMIEDLIAKGSSSLMLLSGILEELRETRGSLLQEMLGLRQTLVGTMQDFGVEAPMLQMMDGNWLDHQADLLPIQTSDLSEEDRSFLMDIAAELGNQMQTTASRMAILWSLESFLQDWIGGLTYEAAHGEPTLGGEQVIH
jgi:hypothetical protein